MSAMHERSIDIHNYERQLARELRKLVEVTEHPRDKKYTPTEFA